MITKDIEKKIKSLPEDLLKEIDDYIDFLLLKHFYEQGKSSNKNFNFKWGGTLSNLKEDYSSVELQHKSLDWR
ncbi:MAG: DUF2281 domain-containing protein [Flexistipes sinusarabici]|uniref:DUF2281 domain-containing protein n=1 Tax=Flexistipes sinusarabici TaxID=2352 RepID=A0A5D0MJM2_FLESI|nr:DUF2281 domain-containing protein [Flexistipes sinusarabici]TYB33924.1 MAG: DUF2281 domain-containing protein [Flexistipes sinusarabici]